jgi:hypothetical protein
MPTVYLSHDPYARHSIIRRIVHTLTTCQWCGNARKTDKDGKNVLFQYGSEDDSISARQHWEDGLFCSKTCHDIYHS